MKMPRIAQKITKMVQNIKRKIKIIKKIKSKIKVIKMKNLNKFKNKINKKSKRARKVVKRNHRKRRRKLLSLQRISISTIWNHSGTQVVKRKLMKSLMQLKRLGWLK